MRAPSLVVSLLLVFPTVAFGQWSRPSALAVDTVAAMDTTTDLNGNRTKGATYDAVVSADLGAGFQAIVRPFAQRTASGEWNRQIWVATVRYERPGPIGVRIEGGLIPPAIGLANMTLRPHLNPTIAQPSSLFTPLPATVVRGSRETLLGGIYPYGLQATVSSTRWDVRAGLIDTSPHRARRVFGSNKPPRLANIFVGGGVTPLAGFRIGGSLTHGGWLSDSEIEGGRDATLVTVESELAFRYTKLSGEVTRSTRHWMECNGPGCDLVASGWYIQGQQTLSPRWFTAGRVERMSAPTIGSQSGRLRFNGVEEVLGYRLTREATLRLAHRARRGFGRPGFDHQIAVSLVFWKRWI